MIKLLIYYENIMILSMNEPNKTLKVHEAKVVVMKGETDQVYRLHLRIHLFSNGQNC